MTLLFISCENKKKQTNGELQSTLTLLDVVQINSAWNVDKMLKKYV